MKTLSVFLLILIFILTGCINTNSGENTDTSQYLHVSAASNSSNSPVPIEKYAMLIFSAAIDGATVNASSVYIADENNVPIAATLTVSKEKISIIPFEFFLPNKPYTIVVTTAVEDIKGRTLENTFTFAFVTALIPDTSPPWLISVTPADGTSVAKTTQIVMEFDETIVGNGVLQLKESDTNTTVNGTMTINDNTLRFVPEGNLIQGSNYTVALQGTVEDLAGNAYDGLTSWNFSVIPASDLRAVSVTYSGKVIRVEFSEYLDPSTVSESDFAINGGSITFKHLIMEDKNIVKFIADSNINGTEEISVSGTIKDIYGNSHNNGVTAIYNLGG